MTQQKNSSCQRTTHLCHLEMYGSSFNFLFPESLITERITIEVRTRFCTECLCEFGGNGRRRGKVSDTGRHVVAQGALVCDMRDIPKLVAFSQ